MPGPSLPSLTHVFYAHLEAALYELRGCEHQRNERPGRSARRKHHRQGERVALGEAPRRHERAPEEAVRREHDRRLEDRPEEGDGHACVERTRPLVAKRLDEAVHGAMEAGRRACMPSPRALGLQADLSRRRRE